MEWGTPAYLWLPLAALPLWLLAWRWEKASRSLAEAVAGTRAGSRGDGSSSRALLLAAFALVAIALGSPRLGSEPQERLAQGGDILVLLDTSKSMLAEDLGRSRLAAAKETLARLTAGLDGDRVGLIAFAGSAFLVCPLTTDYDLFNQVLAQAGPDTIPLGGSSLEAPLVEARRAFDGGRGVGKLVLLISDGEGHGGGYAAAARRLKEAGVTVYTVAAGTPRGALIPLPGGDYLKDASGGAVLSRMQPERLRELAAAAGGGMLGLASLPAAVKGWSGGEGGKTASGPGEKPRERFQVPLSLALALLFIEPLFRRRGEG